MEPSRWKQRGMAFITEILIALSVLIPVMIIVGGMFTFSFSVDRRAWNQRTARSLARSALEEVRGRDFAEMASSTLVWPPASMPAADRAKLASGGTEFRIEVTVDPSGPVDDSVLQRQIRSVVTWRGKNGEERLEAETTVARVYQRVHEPGP